MFGPPDLPRAVALVGEVAHDHGRIEELLSANVIVILLPSLECGSLLVPSADAHPKVAASCPPVFVAGLCIDLTRHRVSWGERVLALSEREIAMLAALCADPGRARSFAELAEPGGGQYLGDRERVHSAIKRLRRKLACCGDTVSIETVRGYGYRLVEPSMGVPAATP